MSKYYDPAFPRDKPAPDGWSQHGMTLRDYFAAKAMQALITRDDLSDEKVANWSYATADAMLAERDK